VSVICKAIFISALVGVAVRLLLFVLRISGDCALWVFVAQVTTRSLVERRLSIFVPIRDLALERLSLCEVAAWLTLLVCNQSHQSRGWASEKDAK